MNTLQIINPTAAGIDVGSEYHYVCVPESRADPRIRKFRCFTEDLEELSAWLKECGVTTVAMESTGVYWIPLYDILSAHGFEVLLVNARYIKAVHGRKTDVKDIQWIQQLHSYGLLHGSFRPDDETCVLRGYMRQRDNLVKGAAVHIQRMQKALVQMNIQLHKAISDITGTTGLKIIQAIVDGERNPHKLAAMGNNQVHNNEETIAASLKDNYRQEHLFTLKQELDLYKYYRQLIDDCDQEISNYLNEHNGGDDDSGGNNPFNLKEELTKMAGVDLTKVPGLGVLSVETLISEVGVNPNKWPSDKHFASWLGLSPANKITGGKVLSSRTRKVNNRAAGIFRTAAVAVGKTKNTALGSFYRKIKAHAGAPKAITATARKLACLFYNLLKHGESYVEKGNEYYERKYKERTIKSLTKRVEELGFNLVEIATG
jgi:transposase